MTFDLVQAVPWAISGVSAVFAGMAFWRTVRAQRLDETRRLTEMASNFAVWVEGSGPSGAKVVYNNRNAVPMTNVNVWLVLGRRVDFGIYASLLPPAGEPREHDELTRALRNRLEGGDSWINPRITAISFMDGAGNTWHRDETGELSIFLNAYARRALKRAVRSAGDEP